MASIAPKTPLLGRSSSMLWTFGALMAFLGAGYGVLFTMLDDFRDEYRIGESALGR